MCILSSNTNFDQRGGSRDDWARLKRPQIFVRYANMHTAIVSTDSVDDNLG
jgi:hypothetical protein